jgi:hypothetical protein
VSHEEQSWKKMENRMSYSDLFICVLACCLFLFGTLALAAPPAQPGTFQAGAARVDITPAQDAALPMSGYSGRKQGFQGIHDRIHVRAVVLHDGTRYAAILTWELIGVPNPGWAELSERIAKETRSAGNL